MGRRRYAVARQTEVTIHMKLRELTARTLVGALGRIGYKATTSRQITIGEQFPEVPISSYVNFQKAYQGHPWVYACVRALADNGAQASLGMFRRRTQGSLELREPIPDHPLSRLFRHPNTAMQLSAFDLKKNMFGFLELSGNSYWFIERNAKTKMVVGLIPLRPDRVEIVPNKMGMIIGYLYTVDGEAYQLQARDVVHIRLWNPYNDYYGQSTLRTAWSTFTSDMFARQYDINFYKKGARPGGALSYDQMLTTDDYERLREEWKKAHQGVDNAHRVAILERGAKWQALGISQKDMDFMEGRKMNREEIAGIFGVPPVMINSYEHANYNTAKTQAQLFWRYTMMPKMTMITDELNENITKLMGPVGSATINDDMFVGWDLSQVAAHQDERREQTVNDTHMVNNGIMTRNEVRATFWNLPPVEGGDVLYRPAGQVPVAEEVPEDEPAPEEPEEEEAEEAVDEPKRIVAGRDGRKEYRLSEWKGFIVRSDFYETRFRGFIARLFADQKKEIIRNLFHRIERGAKDAPRNEMDLESILFNLNEARDFTADASTGLYKSIIKTGGDRGMELAHIGSMFDMDNPRAQRLLEERTNRIKDINDTTWEDVKKDLLIGMKEGDNIRQMADRVERVMGAAAPRKYTIARTEVIGSLNGSMLAGFREAGEVVEQKEWLAAGDESTRESHFELDGERVGLHQPFGAQSSSFTPPPIMYPGDPGGAPNEIINCRCSMLPVLA